MKSVLLTIALAYASATAAALTWPSIEIANRRLVRNLIIFSLCAVAVPALIAGTFALSGLWPQFYEGVFGHNLLPRREPKELTILREILYLLALGAMLLVAVKLRSFARIHGLRVVPAWIALLWGSYLFSLFNIWTMLTRQDYLPTYPLAAVLVAGGALVVGRWLGSRLKWARTDLQVLVPAGICTSGILVTAAMSGFGTDGTRVELALVRDVLRMTQRADFVVDAKGETIFRQRAPFLIYESITNRLIRSGMLPDDIAIRATEMHACFVSTLMQERLPEAGSAFITRNYLQVSQSVRVAGCTIGSPAQQNGASFKTVIPAEYEIVAIDPPVSGELDNKQYEGPCFLQPGLQKFIAAQPHRALAVLWESAAQAHFNPFRFLPRKPTLQSP